jgi:hypothetical protein
MTRGYRNCNPGNIRVSGDKFQGEIIPSQDGLFKQFSNMAYGYRAMFRILKTYIKKYNLNTVGEIIRRWAPGNENDTDSYIKAVSARTGISPGETIRFQDKETMLRLVAAMSYVENGMEPDVSDIHSGWNLL